MAVAHDAQTRFPTTDTTGFDTTTGTRTFTHAGGASAKGAIVVICCTGTTAPVTGVLYGGTAMTAVTNAVDTSEAGRVDIYFLGNLTGKTGSQTVTLQGATAASKFVTCSTVTAAKSTTVVDNFAKQDTTTTANPGVSFNVVANAVVYGAVHGGASAPTTYTATGDMVVQFNGDYGALSARSARSGVTTAGTYDYDFGATSDDWCVAAVSVKELLVPAIGLSPTTLTFTAT